MRHLSFLLVCLLSSASSFAQPQGTGGGFAHLAKFNDEKYYPYYDALMQDRPIQRALKDLMGPDYKKFKETTVTIDIGAPLVGPDGTLRIYGGVPHAFTIAETALIVKPNGSIYVALLQDGKRVLYYTNDKAMARTLPKEFVEWSSRFSDRPVVYKSQDVGNRSN